jgi:SAM-dependent methyltransferase
MNLSENLTCSRYKWAEQCLQDLLPSAPASIVNDIGAGGGEMRPLVEGAGGKWQGFDLFPKSPDICPWNLDDPAPDNCRSAGIILLLDVLEHLNNPWLAVHHLADTLLPGGFLILSVPNPHWSRSRYHALAKGNPICFTQLDLDMNHHVFTPWQHIVEHLLIETGFSIKHYVTLDGPTRLPGKPYNLRYPLRCAFALINLAIERQDPTACGMSYGVVARKEFVE